MSESKCIHCPLFDLPGIPCHSRTHPRYCELIADGREWARECVVKESLKDHPEIDPAKLIPPKAVAAPADRVPSNRELVVSWYREDISWIRDVKIPVTVYAKDIRARIPEIPGVTLIRRPNRGREAETMLNHICQNYDSLSAWTFFVQGAPHADDLLGRLGVDYMDSTPLTREYKPDFPTADVKAMDRVEWHGGFEVRYGLADPVRKGLCSACDLPCSDVWCSVFASPMPDPCWWFGYGAEWAVPRHRIRARPLGFWSWLRDKVASTPTDTHIRLYGAWSLELLWAQLFGDADVYRHRGAEPVAKVSNPGGCNCGKDRPRLNRGSR